MSAFIDRLQEAATRSSPLPPVSASIGLRNIHDSEVVADPGISDEELQSILGFACVIEYSSEPRLITCRRYDKKGALSYVGAICHSAGGYRQFRTDRIDAVIDPASGEVLGAGSFFDRFEPKSDKTAVDDWGLTRSRKSTLNAGLNVLAFIARCDGYWHPLEHEPIENFITSMWMRKEWEGDPPIDRIIAHAQRLAPSAVEALSALKYYARSDTSTRILLNSVTALIAADGLISSEENMWAVEIARAIDELQAAEFRKYVGDLHS